MLNQLEIRDQHKSDFFGSDIIAFMFLNRLELFVMLKDLTTFNITLNTRHTLYGRMEHSGYIKRPTMVEAGRRWLYPRYFKQSLYRYIPALIPFTLIINNAPPQADIQTSWNASFVLTAIKHAYRLSSPTETLVRWVREKT